MCAGELPMCAGELPACADDLPVCSAPLPTMFADLPTRNHQHAAALNRFGQNVISFNLVVSGKR